MAECFCCGQSELSKNEVGLNKKLLGRNVVRFMCLDCLADYMGVTADQLLARVEDFKAEGCKLFG